MKTLKTLTLLLAVVVLAGCGKNSGINMTEEQKDQAMDKVAEFVSSQDQELNKEETKEAMEEFGKMLNDTKVRYPYEVKDGKVYYKSNLIEGADAESFEVSPVASGSGRDKFFRYNDGEKVTMSPTYCESVLPIVEVKNIFPEVSPKEYVRSGPGGTYITDIDSELTMTMCYFKNNFAPTHEPSIKTEEEMLFEAIHRSSDRDINETKRDIKEVFDYYKSGEAMGVRKEDIVDSGDQIGKEYVIFASSNKLKTRVQGYFLSNNGNYIVSVVIQTVNREEEVPKIIEQVKKLAIKLEEKEMPLVYKSSF